MTSKQLYEKYKGCEAKFKSVCGIVCGYMPDIEDDSDPNVYSLIMVTDSKVGWDYGKKDDDEIIEIDNFINKRFLYIKEGDIVNRNHTYCKSWTSDDLLSVMNLGMDLRQNQLNGQCDRSGVDVLNDWIERNSKIK